MCPSIDNELNVKSSQVKTMCVGMSNLTHVYPYICVCILASVGDHGLEGMNTHYIGLYALWVYVCGGWGAWGHSITCLKSNSNIYDLQLLFGKTQLESWLQYLQPIKKCWYIYTKMCPKSSLDINCVWFFSGVCWLQYLQPIKKFRYFYTKKLLVH